MSRWTTAVDGCGAGAESNRDSAKGIQPEPVPISKTLNFELRGLDTDVRGHIEVLIRSARRQTQCSVSGLGISTGGRMARSRGPNGIVPMFSGQQRMMRSICGAMKGWGMDKPVPGPQMTIQQEICQTHQEYKQEVSPSRHSRQPSRSRSPSHYFCHLSSEQHPPSTSIRTLL